MKKNSVILLLISGFSVFALLMINFPVIGQATLKQIPTLPEGVNKIVIASCTPCHTNEGGLMAKSKLNFTEWTKYSPEKKKEKAAKMYSELSKGDMPPKAARQKRPDLIPDQEQIDIIKKWSESIPADNK
jgi:hypothetical protein